MKETKTFWGQYVKTTFDPADFFFKVESLNGFPDVLCSVHRFVMMLELKVIDYPKTDRGRVNHNLGAVQKRILVSYLDSGCVGVVIAAIPHLEEIHFLDPRKLSPMRDSQDDYKKAIVHWIKLRKGEGIRAVLLTLPQEMFKVQ